MRIVASAGEASGRVMLELFRQEMAGVEPGCEVVSLDEPSELGPVFGFAEGLRSGRVLQAVLRRSEESVTSLKPDAVVLISFSGLHLPLGRRLRNKGVPVLYLGPPQLWAWGGWRKRKLRAAADRVVCLFRFEAGLLRRAGVNAEYLGYPLLDGVVSRLSREQMLEELGIGPRERYAVFLPGSRPAEIAHHAPLFEAAYAHLLKSTPDIRGVFVEAATQSTDQRPMSTIKGLISVREGRYDAMRHAECALAVSGTVTAELAILGVPMVVSYHLSWLSRVLARALVRTRYFALPNVLAGTKVVPEELEAGPEKLAGLLAPLVRGSDERRGQLEALGRVAAELGPPGAMARVCSLAAAMARREGG